MGLLDHFESDLQYYDNNHHHGNYQFVSLQNIIEQFEIAYVGENKLIPKIKKADISFFAQRAMQELSFDTFKSFKSFEVEVPPKLSMILPQDYVNYTKLSWVDTAGIKHPLYQTRHTSNPFKIKQLDDGEYDFSEGSELLVNGNFSNSVLGDNWSHSSIHTDAGDSLSIAGGSLQIQHNVTHQNVSGGTYWGRAAVGFSYAMWQAVDVTGVDYVYLSADALPASEEIGGDGSSLSTSEIRVGLTTTDPSVGWEATNHPDYNVTKFFTATTATMSASRSSSSPNSFYYPQYTTPTITKEVVFDLTKEDGTASYLEWDSSETSLGTTTKRADRIDIPGNVNTIYLLIHSHTEFTNNSYTAANYTERQNGIDNISVKGPGVNLLRTWPSTTLDNFQSTTPSENNNDDYEDDVYWPINGERYGLEPSHAQVNGSFHIDDTLGRIYFSSNISGKTVVLDYISDSLGTDREMQVHKFAEEAMYKWIIHAIMSTSSYGQQLVPRLKKEKFAAVRQAKLRLSNIKLEELTQILRGKSKQIKH